MNGEYVIKVRLARDILENVPAFAEDQHLEVSLDGERIQVLTVPGIKPPPVAPAPPAPAGTNTGTAPPRAGISQIDAGIRVSAAERALRNNIDDAWDVRVSVKAGARQLNVTFIKLTAAIDETSRLPFIKPVAANVNISDNRMGNALRSVEIVGPYNPSSPGDSPSRRRIFVCEAKTTAEENGCAKTILSALARRAYRRPVTDADIKPLLASYEEARPQGTFDTGIVSAVSRLLVSPEFLFRV
jgi:hypothetical protein